jgi:hypothetical protein
MKTAWAVFLAMGLAGLACGGLAPPKSCGSGGTADEGAFSQYFESMELVDEVTLTAGPPTDESAVTFDEDAPLIIRASVLSDVILRACVQQRAGGGQIVFDQTATLSAGDGHFPIGAFEPGDYVVRVEAEGVLVRNLTFTIR